MRKERRGAPVFRFISRMLMMAVTESRSIFFFLSFPPSPLQCSTLISSSPRTVTTTTQARLTRQQFRSTGMTVHYH